MSLPACAPRVQWLGEGGRRGRPHASVVLVRPLPAPGPDLPAVRSRQPLLSRSLRPCRTHGAPAPARRDYAASAKGKKSNAARQKKHRDKAALARRLSDLVPSVTETTVTHRGSPTPGPLAQVVVSSSEPPCSRSTTPSVERSEPVVESAPNTARSTENVSRETVQVGSPRVGAGAGDFASSRCSVCARLGPALDGQQPLVRPRPRRRRGPRR